MSQTKKVQSFKKKMTTSDFLKFKRFCEQSVDMNAKNTPNKKSKDLAEFQIDQLTEQFVKDKNDTN